MILYTTQDGSIIFSENNLELDLKTVEIENIYELIQLHPMFDPLSLMGCYRFRVIDDTNEILPMLARNFVENGGGYSVFYIELLKGLSVARIVHQALDAYPYSVARGWAYSLRVVIPHTITNKEDHDLIVMKFADDSRLTIRVNDTERTIKGVAT